MSTGQDGGGGGRGRRKLFLSAHRCPEVDLLPHHNSETQIPPLCSLAPAEKNPKFTCTGQSEANYLDVFSANRSEKEEEDGSISDWSEEDLSLHFSPSVIHPSDDEESDPESSFECIDITMETQEKGQEGEGPKMVPKRQIQLKKKEAENIINKEKTEEIQVMLKDGPGEGGVANGEVSANELLCHNVHHRPDLLLRQHSMPASLHTHSVTSSDVDSCRVYRGLVAGASQGFQVGGNSRQRLQKSFSLDETKTKMASCIIKNVLSKKMQAEQNNSKSSYLQKKPAALPGLLKSVDQQRVREGGGGKTGGEFKAPVHVVRDMRSVVKNSYGVSFPTAPTTTPENNKQKSIKVIGQDKSPPPTYQQAMGVKGQDETNRSSQATAYSSSGGGHITRVAASLSQSQHSNYQSNRFSRPITQQQRGREPITNKSKVEDVTCSDVLLDLPANLPASSDLSELNQSERDGGVSHQDGTSLPSTCIQAPPPPRPPSKPVQCKETQPLLSAQEQSFILGVSSHSAPSSSQQIFQSCFYTPTALHAFPTTLRPHIGKVSYMHTPLSYIQTRLQHVQNVPTLHLLRRSDENQSSLTGNTSDQQDCFIKTGRPHQTRTTRDQESSGNTEKPATQEQKEQQKHQQQKFQGFLPTQVGSDLLVDITGSNAAPRILLSDAASCHIMLDPTNGQCFYVDKPPQPQRKMLLDPETGQYVQVFLPASSSTPTSTVLPVNFANPASFAPSMINPTPTVLSVMQFQPTVAVSSLYGTPCLPFTLHTPSVNFTHTAL